MSEPQQFLFDRPSALSLNLWGYASIDVGDQPHYEIAVFDGDHSVSIFQLDNTLVVHQNEPLKGEGLAKIFMTVPRTSIGQIFSLHGKSLLEAEKVRSQFTFLDVQDHAKAHIASRDIVARTSGHGLFMQQCTPFQSGGRLVLLSGSTRKSGIGGTFKKVSICMTNTTPLLSLARVHSGSVYVPQDPALMYYDRVEAGNWAHWNAKIKEQSPERLLKTQQRFERFIERYAATVTNKLA